MKSFTDHNPRDVTSRYYQLFGRFILALVMAFAVSAVLGGTTGKIAGQVTDRSTGESLAGVNIYLDGHPYGAASDEEGYYFIINIPPGKYTVIAQMIGYNEVRVEDVKVSVDLTTKLSFDLTSEQLELGEDIVVIAERPMIQNDVTSTAVSVSADEIAALPVDNFNEIVDNQAGVIDGHFRGGRTGEVAYMVDGIPVNDPYNNAISVEIENTSIQELEVITGTFNAEYGQAMSGVVNTVTKDGSTSEYELDFSGYASNFYTTHNEIFPNLENLDGSGAQNFQVTASGPIPYIDNLTFFVTGRYNNNDGFLYGRRVYEISDSNPFLPSGNDAFVSMNDNERKTVHGKLTYRLSPNMKIGYGFLAGDLFNRYYDHAYQLTPDGIKDHLRENIHNNLIFTHTLSNSTFYTVKVSRNISLFKGYVFEDPFDPRYVIPEQGLPQSAYTFRSGGNQSDRYRRTTTTYLGKADLTSQVSRFHKIGAGIVAQQHNVDQFWTSMESRPNPLNPQESILVYPEAFSPGQEKYKKEPLEISAYVQDKMEYEDFIINIGLRFDYFDPNTLTLTDIRNPANNELFPFGNKEAEQKMQLSPRLGVAFPISSKGVIHVSYGHFFQVPRLEQLYANISDFDDGTTRFLISTAGLSTVTGNPNLEPERTVSYEAGLQQVLYEDFAVDFTAYYRDIRNLVDTEVIETYDKNQYGRFINRDYANIRGVVLSFEKRFSNYWGARLDYTYQFAEGNASDPRSVFQDNQSDPPREPEKKLIPLDWDQRTTINLSLNAGVPGDWNVGLIGRYGTGTPYTADLRFALVNVNFRNNRSKPSKMEFDFRLDKSFNIAGTRISTYLIVFNLLDRLNENDVYGSSGNAGTDLNTKFAGDIIGLNTIDEYVRNPTFYSAPREIRLGLAFGL